MTVRGRRRTGDLGGVSLNTADDGMGESVLLGAAAHHQYSPQSRVSGPRLLVLRLNDHNLIYCQLLHSCLDVALLSDNFSWGF